MDQLLRNLHTQVRTAKNAGHAQLENAVLADYEDRYAQTIARGDRDNPLRTIATGKRGVIKQTTARNLLTRLDRDRQQVLRFARDFRVPFDNNQAERDIRMVKLQQKISGCWRTIPGTDQFLALRSYLSTATKHHEPLVPVLTRLADHDPWTPTTTT